MKPIRYFTGKPGKSADWHWAYTTIIAGIFIGIFSIAIVAQQTFVTKLEVSKYLAFCSLIWFLVPLRVYSKWLNLEKLEIFLLGILGIGPLVLSVLLWTNYLVMTEVNEIEYQIVEIIPESYNVSGGGLTSVLYRFEFDAMVEYPEFRRFEYTGDQTILYTKAVKYKFGKGIFGYDVVKDRQLLK